MSALRWLAAFARLAAAGVLLLIWLILGLIMAPPWFAGLCALEAVEWLVSDPPRRWHWRRISWLHAWGDR